MNVQSHRIVIIGGGPSAIAAALEATKYTHDIVMVSNEPVGGNAVLHSLVPSKALIEAAHHRQYLARLGADPDTITLSQVMALQEEQIKTIVETTQKALNQVQTVFASAHLEKHHGEIHVVTDSQQHFVGETVIIANGSRQRLIPGLKPDGQSILLPRAFHTLKSIPHSLAIIGAGATGLEAASLFAHFGTHVTLYTPLPQLLPQFSPPLRQVFTHHMENLGIQMQFNRRIASLARNDEGIILEWHNPETGEKGQSVHHTIFLATGREGMWAADELIHLGFDVDPQGFFITDRVGQTNVPHVYAVGDAQGRPLLANKASWQGVQAVRHAFGHAASPPPLFVEAIYTIPELARFGTIDPDNLDIWEAKVDHPLMYKPFLMGHELGLVRVYTRNDRIEGAEAIGTQAADVISLLAMVNLEVTLPQLIQSSAASPTMMEWLQHLHRI
ncbi:FAD-dependent oxidoreductase [Sulfobacillus thermosulfidooxidans]|uniref:FAD-dependent oxidoreductase n=1 Tax=Sulfobacillus thermosulfidooxidans TaxID=28034 RepID=UPI0009F849A2|nr:NAD(P)/FAD-dependent oxidoreductase [Sulfobacillus thermosulfidooxidans]